MKISDLMLQEAVGKPVLYHYTTLNGLKGIISSNALKAGAGHGKIYLTRDLRRQFIPHSMFSDSFGLRMDSDSLKRDFGRKLKPQGQMSSDVPQDPFASNWFFTANQRDELARVKAQLAQGEKPSSGLLIHGRRPEEWLRGQVAANSRWESEEVLDVKELTPITKYVTGLVLAPGGISPDKFTTKDKSTQLAIAMSYAFGKGAVGKANRDIIIPWLVENNIPVVFGGKDVSAAQALQLMIKWFQDQKAERESPLKKSWQVDVYNPGGETIFRSFATTATSSEKAVEIIRNKGFSDPAWVIKAHQV
jgi:hypothetical protein